MEVRQLISNVIARGFQDDILISCAQKNIITNLVERAAISQEQCDKEKNKTTKNYYQYFVS